MPRAYDLSVRPEGINIDNRDFFIPGIGNFDVGVQDSLDSRLLLKSSVHGFTHFKRIISVTLI